MSESTVAIAGIVVGGGVAILTTLANLAYNWFQKKSELRFGMRQQVYLEACDWAARGNSFLASFARLDLNDVQLGQILQDSNASYYKIHVIAKEKTIMAFNAASEYLAKKAVELMATRIQLRHVAAHIQALQKDADQTAAYQQQLAAIIDNVPKASPTDQILATIPQLVTDFTITRDKWQKIQTGIKANQEKASAMQEELYNASLIASSEYGDYLAAANVAAREELDLKLNETTYRQSLNASSGRVIGAIKQMVERLKSRSPLQ